MRRRILKKFVLEYIAGVDRPAAAGATARIMKRAEGRTEKLDMSFSKAELADAVLTGAAVALRKREPHLSPEQAYAKIFTSPEYRLAAKAEREGSTARLAGVPVARTAAHVLNCLDDNSINELTIQIKQAHPYLDDAGIVRLLIQRVEATDVGKALSQADLRRLVDHERFLNPTLSDEAVYRRVSASRAARLDRRELAAEMEASRRDDVMGKRDDALAELRRLADEARAEDSSLSPEMAFSKVFLDPRNRALAARERASSREALES